MLSTPFKKVQPDAATPAARKPKGSRLVILLVLGAVAVAAGLLVRNSTWARERRLKTLSVEELAYAVHDDPNDALTFFYYGSELLKTGNPPSSETAFQRAIQLD